MCPVMKEVRKDPRQLSVKTFTLFEKKSTRMRTTFGLQLVAEYEYEY